MKRKKNNKKLTLLLVLVLLISVGYAALASNLKINGTTGVKSSTWSVYWDNVQINEGSVPADDDHKARITDTAKTQVEYSVVLSEPGDFYEFTVDAVNNGTIDAMIDEDGIVNGVYTDSTYETKLTTIPKALKYTVTYADGSEIEEKHLLAKKSGSNPTKETYKVRVEYSEDVDSSDLGNTDQAFYFKFSVNYVQADGTAVDKNASAIRRVYTQNEGQITPGDIIGIGKTEDFYVISSDATKTVLVAKYNLLVGNESHDQGSTATPMNPSTTQGYGLQSIDAISYDWNRDEWKGSVVFSSTNYWHNGGLISPYNANGASYSGNPYPYVYNSSLTTAPDFSSECDYSTNCFYTPGYSIAYYVEQYKTKLIEMGAPSTITGRLLTYEEANSAQTIQDNGTSIMSNGQSYWLGSASGDDFVWSVDPDGYLSGSGYYGNDSSWGVRPVIEISTSEIK